MSSRNPAAPTTPTTPLSPTTMVNITTPSSPAHNITAVHNATPATPLSNIARGSPQNVTPASPDSDMSDDSAAFSPSPLRNAIPQEYIGISDNVIPHYQLVPLFRRPRRMLFRGNSNNEQVPISQALVARIAFNVLDMNAF